MFCRALVWLGVVQPFHILPGLPTFARAGLAMAVALPALPPPAAERHAIWVSGSLSRSSVRRGKVPSSQMDEHDDKFLRLALEQFTSDLGEAGQDAPLGAQECHSRLLGLLLLEYAGAWAGPLTPLSRERRACSN